MTGRKKVGNAGETKVGSGCLNDSFNRKINYLRVSITDRCNLQCRYCVSHTPSPKLAHHEILRYEEILKIIRAGVRHGISKVRITGGEPLSRKGVYPFLEELGRIPGLDDISLTTNGVLLQDGLPAILKAGIRRLNISLDTLKREKFKEITGFDKLDAVMAAIYAAHDAGIAPLKINVVALPDINDDELEDFAALTFSYPFHIRFIEYMPIGTPELKMTNRLLTPDIRQRISRLGELLPVEKSVQDGPAARYRFKDAQGEVGFISPVSNHFCSTCNRMRLTASGKLRSCLLSDQTVDIAGPLRAGCSEEELYQCLLKAVAQKGEKHCLNDDTGGGSVESPMFSIGG